MHEDTIVALSSPAGTGAIALIRLSGPDAISLAAQACPDAKVGEFLSHTAHLVRIQSNETLLDEAVLTLYRAPKSFTREDVAEFACHGSPYIVQKVLELMTRLGARMAGPGEFTFRAYLNGAMDLAQAEAVADLIASESERAHHLALHQMRGGFSDTLKQLRIQMLDFVSLIELELDFGEEDVEFANRDQLRLAVEALQLHIRSLADSFSIGNVIRKGIPTAIIGKPNAGKSTLLNALLNDSRAIVSEIAGTTRDVIEDRLFLKGLEFRLMDTAGIRDTQDSIEQQGIERSLDAVRKARVVLYVFDVVNESPEEARQYCKHTLPLAKDAGLLLIANKTDIHPLTQKAEDVIEISALNKTGLEFLSDKMVHAAGIHDNRESTYVTHARHHKALLDTLENLSIVKEGLRNGLSGELIAEDLRAAMYALGSITGDISSDEILGNIFGKFCIGK